MMPNVKTAENSVPLRSKRNSHHVTEHAPPAIPLCPNITSSPENNKFRSSKGAKHDADTQRKATFGHGARTHRQIREEVSATVVMKSQVAQIARASEVPEGEIIFDESVYSITSIDLKEIHQMARFLPVIVVIPRSTGAHQVAPNHSSMAKSSSERSEPTDLLGVLGKVAERFKGTSSRSTVAFGDVTINFSAMEALRKGEPVVLTTMEFKTLKYLIQNARRVISRDELLNEVWGYGNYPCTRTVDNLILRLRRKLERILHAPSTFGQCMAPATSSYPSAAMAPVERCGRSSDRCADSRRTEVTTVKPGVFLAIFLVWIVPTGRAESPRRVDIIAERSVCSSFKTSTWHGEVNRVPDAEAAQALTCVADFAAELPTEKYGTKMTPSGVVTNSNYIHSHISLDMKPNGTTRDECDDEFRLLERTGKGTSWRQRRNCP
jgi:hypothetical protein